MSAKPRTGIDVTARLDAAEGLLGVTFRDRSLLRTALTHGSWTAEHGDEDYQRLEFLGDSVLGLLVAEHLYKAMPQEPEGTLARLRAEVVSGTALGEVAQELGIDDVILAGRGATTKGGGKLTGVRADVMEAVIGATYLDRGMRAARDLVERLVIPHALPRALAGATRDPKGVLQEHASAGGGEPPFYTVIAKEGPVHEPVFTVTVSLGGDVLGTGTGPSKKAAEKAAAAAAVSALGIAPA